MRDGLLPRTSSALWNARALVDSRDPFRLLSRRWAAGRFAEMCSARPTIGFKWISIQQLNALGRITGERQFDEWATLFESDWQQQG